MSLIVPRRVRPADGGTGQNPTTASGLLALAPPQRLYSVNPIYTFNGGPTVQWNGGQVQEPCIFLDPTNSSQYIMFFCGQFHGGNGGYIARATAPVSNPTQWTVYGTLLFGGNNRLDSVVWDPVASQFLAYSTVDVGGGNYQVNLYTSSDGFTFTAYGSNPVWQPSQCTKTGCTTVSNLAVYRADAAHWYGYYAHRGSYGINPDLRLCTSSDGKNWTDTGTISWAQGAGGTYDSQYKEWHQIIQSPDGTFMLVAECNDSSQWTIGAATSSSLTGVFTKQSAPIFAGSGNQYDFDSNHVATPAIYNLGGKWFLFYCGTNAPRGGSSYSLGYWSMGMAEF